MNNKGFSLVEILVAVSVFLVFFLSLTNVIFSSSKKIEYATNNEVAIFLAESGLEIVKNIKDEDFNNLQEGVYGLERNLNQFEFISSPEDIDIFSRSIIISNIDEFEKKVESTVSWVDSFSDHNSITLTTYFTNWVQVSDAVCLDQQDFLEVYLTEIQIAGNSKLNGILVGSSAIDCEIIIEQMQVSWTSSGRRLRHIIFDGLEVWSGNVNSGTVKNIESYSIKEDQNNLIVDLDFSGNISNDTFSITFFMSDGTSKTITDIKP